jgi:branched-chain amino acid transport system substrate-binding protein
MTTARDLSVEVAKARATGAEALLMVSRLNDAILIARELVKGAGRRWPAQHGTGWYEDQYLRTSASSATAHQPCRGTIPTS